MSTVAPAVVDVEPVLVLAEVMCRLRAAGAVLPTDRDSLAAAHGHMAGLLSALGLPADADLSEADWHMLRCVATPRVV